MSNLWINWNLVWWRLQVGPDRPFVRIVRTAPRRAPDSPWVP